jgi:hypothetical protein
MSLVIAKPTGNRLTLAKTYVGIDDPDAAAYITAVEAADTAAGQSGGLETATKVAIHSFVKGCKADGIWPAIKASCILAGARTLPGALVPLAGTAPTNVNFVSGDYNRKTGLIGDGSTKYLNSNRNNNADPQNSIHNCVYVSSAPSGDFDVFIGSDVGATVGGNMIQLGGTGNGSTSDLLLQNRTTSSSPIAGQGTTLGLKGISRATSVFYSYRSGQQSNSITATSSAATSVNTLVFATRLSSLAAYSNARLAFYSIGESLDLALLDTRVSALITAFGVAIP